MAINELKIAGIAAVLVAAGGGIAYATVPSVQNAVLSTVLSPQQYYLSIEKKNVENIANDISEKYNSAIEKKESLAMSSYSDFSFEISNSFLEGLGLPEIKPIKFSMDTNIKDDQSQINVKGYYDENELLTIESLSDGEKFYFRSPELMDKYGAMAIPDIAQEDKTEAKELQDILSKEDLSYLITNYGEFILDELQNNEFSKEKKSDTGLLEIKIKTTNKEILETLKKLMEKAKNDEKLISIYNNYYNELQTSVEDYELEIPTWSSLFSESIEGISTSINGISEDNICTMFFKVYIDSEGNIKGRELETTMPSDINSDSLENNHAVIGYLLTSDGNENNDKYYMMSSDEYTSYDFSINNKWTVNADTGSKSGTVSININSDTNTDTSEENSEIETASEKNYKFDIKYSDFKYDNGYITGKIDTDTSSVKESDDVLGINFDMKGSSTNKEQSFNISLDHNHEKFLEIKTNTKVRNPQNITFPTSDEYIELSEENIETEITSLINQEKATNWFENLSNISNLGELLSSALSLNALSGNSNDIDGQYDDYGLSDFDNNSYLSENSQNNSNDFMTDYFDEDNSQNDSSSQIDYNQNYDEAVSSNTDILANPAQDDENYDVNPSAIPTQNNITELSSDNSTSSIRFITDLTNETYYSDKEIPLIIGINDSVNDINLDIYCQIDDMDVMKIYSQTSTTVEQQLALSLPAFSSGTHTIKFLVQNANGDYAQVGATINVLEPEVINN